MRILLDPQIFSDQLFGGISRYYTEVYSNLNKRDGVSVILPIVNSKNVYIQNSDLFIKASKSKLNLIAVLNSLGISTRSYSKSETEKAIKNAFLSSNFDLFIPTYYNPYFLDSIGEKPFVLTVYDMIHELFPQYFINDIHNVVANKRLLIEKATKIIAVSNNTKKDIVRLYPHIDASKIEVIYHGNSIKVHNDVKVDLPNKYILFVGSRWFYKNFTFFIETIKEMLYKDKSLHVLCAGGGEFTPEEKQFIKDLGLEDQVLFKYFQENELGQYYKNAICFVFPSNYEGFGIPVLESMACGCPIVLTNNSSFPEVAGDAGVFFEMDDADDLRNKINSLINDENLRNDYILKGYEQVKKFTWNGASQQCLELFQKII